ncbi:tRNA pseudouridine(55) synthase TruB [Pseudohaliea rubra]|uniref:tRNA pseudouridine synthase B n=1 Tax=Pseudohaliea rubra DSM 19751 TaxID=1265313 RepID=A0A095VNM5_9GAMM|nr:tRNA pseudouridine(55) synthase TruB [Pseudohaliea rubra]KGE02698.1 tRNA pseudouridine synthase B [Pseudohaliea rubra DSM 19751]
MARRRHGRPLSGILVLDKPPGLSSNRALQRVKGLYRAAKAGHTGSLDPLATGVLPLCFGEATKVSQYLLEADKVYESTFTFGVSTDTGDAEGTETGRSDAGALAAAEVEAALVPFRGEIEQVPSMFSAIKQGGRPLYELARQGVEVERKARRITVHAFELLAFRPGEQAEADVRVHCSKGTYVRSLAEDLGAALGYGAHVSRLRRLQSGPFRIEQALTLEALQALRDAGDEAALDRQLLPAELALADMPLVTLSESAGFYLRQGQAVLVPNAPCDGMVRVAAQSGELLGVGEILDDGRVAPRRLMVTRR